MKKEFPFRIGDHLAICDSCGMRFYASELRRRWDGFMVCSEDFEERHPQDLIRAVADNQNVPWVRSESADVFITPAPADPNSL